jgi:DNA helicase-2/ATP-dependent DNA helicase PcrA
MHEDAAIANHIERLYKEGFPLEEVAVIYAKHKQARNIISLLERKRIPYNTKRRVNILDLPLIENLRTFLQYLYFEYKTPHSGEEFLFKILHFDFLGIPPTHLARLSMNMAKYGRARQLQWRDVIADVELLEKWGIHDPQALLRCAELLDGLITDFGNLRCILFLERLINRSGMLHHVLHHQEKAWMLQIISTFFDFVKRETDKNPRLNVKKLIDILVSMDDNFLPIGVNKTVSADNGVNLLTVHGSKGLEFQVVFMIDANKDWDAGGRGNRYRFALPDTITYSTEEDATEARRRLFYVAMTRAKEQLHISYAHKDNSTSILERTQFIDELLADREMDLKVEDRVLPPEEIISVQGLLLSELEKPKIDAQEEGRINELLEGFTLSVSAMNSYQRCALSFYYEYVLRIPSVPNEAATYGTAMHNALKRLFDKMLAHPEKEFPSVEELVEDFKKELKRRIHYFSKKGYNRRRRMGERNLTTFYAANINKWNKHVVPEMDIRNVEYKGVPIKGSLDKVEALGEKKVRIVDYKTGSMDKRKLRPPSKSEPNGGIYWRQLYFYKILHDHYRNHNRKVTGGEIAYLETNSKGEFLRKSLHYNPEDESTVGDMMVDTYQRIMNREFYEGCGKSTCKWCGFVKRHVIVDSFANEDAGDLDD